MPESLSRTLPGVPSSVREARTELRGFLGESTRLDDALLVLDELAANAVLHGCGGAGGQFEIRFELGPGHLRIEVSHAGDAGAVVLPPADEAFAPGEHDAFPYGESGRGLLLVDALADKWGLDSAPGGSVLWWAQLWTQREVTDA